MRNSRNFVISKWNISQSIWPKTRVTRAERTQSEKLSRSDWPGTMAMWHALKLLIDMWVWSLLWVLALTRHVCLGCVRRRDAEVRGSKPISCIPTGLCFSPCLQVISFMFLPWLSLGNDLWPRIWKMKENLPLPSCICSECFYHRNREANQARNHSWVHDN